MHPSLQKSAHFSLGAPLGKFHIPYSRPSVFFLITVVPPTFPQFTDAGYAIPAMLAERWVVGF
ncbi:MAG: hypothetical protein WC391_00215 [Methanoregula sp.]